MCSHEPMRVALFLCLCSEISWHLIEDSLLTLVVNRAHLLLASEGIIYFILALLDLLSHLVPGASTSLSSFKGLDILTGKRNQAQFGCRCINGNNFVPSQVFCPLSHFSFSPSSFLTSPSPKFCPTSPRGYGHLLDIPSLSPYPLSSCSTS